LRHLQAEHQRGAYAAHPWHQQQLLLLVAHREPFSGRGQRHQPVSQRRRAAMPKHAQRRARLQ
jgi:hypothetical protein